MIDVADNVMTTASIAIEVGAVGTAFLVTLSKEVAVVATKYLATQAAVAAGGQISLDLLLKRNALNSVLKTLGIDENAAVAVKIGAVIASAYAFKRTKKSSQSDIETPSKPAPQGAGRTPNQTVAPSKVDEASASTLYRVQGGTTAPKISHERVVQLEDGTIKVVPEPGKTNQTKLCVTFDDLGAVTSLSPGQSTGRSKIVSVEVDPKFVQEVRANAKAQAEIRANRGAPEISDPGKTSLEVREKLGLGPGESSAYGLPSEWINKLEKAMVKGTLKVVRIDCYESKFFLHVDDLIGITKYGSHWQLVCRCTVAEWILDYASYDPAFSPSRSGSCFPWESAGGD